MLSLSLVALLAASPAAEKQTYKTFADGSIDFTDEAKLLFKIVACAGDAEVPKELDPKILDAHCKELNRRADKYKATWIEKAKPFIQKLKPEGLPTTVVYPFGGGDLISALTTYPDAQDITTMSLEHAGDPRRIRKITNKQLKESLALIRATSSGLLVANDSKTENLMKGQRGEIPGQLSFFLIALMVHGYEPVKVRYVKVKPDGTLYGLTVDELEKLESKEAQLLKKGWTSPDFSEAFDNVELTFAKKGESAQRTHRHFAFNLDNDHFGTPEDGQKKFLDTKGRVVAMTKAASYLLWRPNFSNIRTWLLEHMEFMVSDSTGVPPQIAKEAGFEQQFFGRFDESFLAGNPKINADFKKLWEKAPPLPFRYGYVDKKLQNHMMITKKAAAPAK